VAPPPRDPHASILWAGMQLQEEQR
jgi:hypothetical protein